jgi:hypothetical protein
MEFRTLEEAKNYWIPEGFLPIIAGPREVMIFQEGKWARAADPRILPFRR